MKALYSNTLKSLVTDGTITQSQSDKVLVAETKNTPQNTATGKDRAKGVNKPNGRKSTNS